MKVLLYTPATGYPDLEAKIAYGLTRVAVEAYGTEAVKVTSLGGYYQVEIEGELERLNQTLNFLVRRLLSSARIPSEIPGIESDTAANLMINENDALYLTQYASVIGYANHRNSEPVCRHRTIQETSNVLGFTAMANTGVNCSRDRLDTTVYQRVLRRVTQVRKLCKTCASLALIGMWFSCFFLNVGDTEVVVTPLPEEPLTQHKLEELYSLQSMSRGIRISEKIPMRLIPLVFFSKVPSSAEILRNYYLFVAVLSQERVYRVDGLFIVDVENYARFFENYPFNTATVDILVRNINKQNKKKDIVGVLFELDRVLTVRNPSDIVTFARVYAKNSSEEGTNLLYPETSKYLLKEVAMIDQEIIENPSINALAKTLRYFVRERNYGYVDSIRNARKESRDFEETVAKMLREAELRRVQQEQEREAGREVKNWVYIPKTDEIQEVFRLAEKDFESTKLALSILAFTFPSKGEEKTE